MNRVFLIVVLMLCGWATAGCAIHYFDPTTGTEHLWGIGHLKMKVIEPNEGVQGVMRSTELLGISIGAIDRQAYLTLGWSEVQRLDIAPEGASFSLAGPRNDLGATVLGSQFPHRRQPDENSDSSKKMKGQEQIQ